MFTFLAFVVNDYINEILIGIIGLLLASLGGAIIAVQVLKTQVRQLQEDHIWLREQIEKIEEHSQTTRNQLMRIEGKIDRNGNGHK